MPKAQKSKLRRGLARGKKRAALSAQHTIPYTVMHPDGVCQLPGNLYTKTIEYEDINYSVASADDQTAIFSGWSSFLNYFDSSLPFQLSFVNRRSHSAGRYTVNIPAQHDEYDSIRAEFVGMLKSQIAKSNNGIERAKYITFGVPADFAAFLALMERAGYTVKHGRGGVISFSAPGPPNFGPAPWGTVLAPRIFGRSLPESARSQSSREIPWPYPRPGASTS